MHPAARRAGTDTPPAFLCDRMLLRLARWLRAAGYDTAIAEDGASDREVLERAMQQRRTLLTRDRKMLELRGAPRHVVVLRGNSLPDCADEATARLGLDWLLSPFSRCLLCNLPVAAAPSALLARVPPASRRDGDDVLYCPACDKVYWPGGHVRRMHAKLSEWRQGRFR